MPEMTGGQALIRSMRREGAEVVFGLPGVQMYHAIDPILDEPGMHFITVRHEQATGYMADGFTRAGGGTGTAMVVPGPGLLNASAAIGTAYAASSPILVVSGQVQKDLIGKDVGILHEVNDQMDAIRPVTKAAYRVLNAADVPAAVHEAFRQLRTGRPRPVEIEIPPKRSQRSRTSTCWSPATTAATPRPTPTSSAQRACWRKRRTPSSGRAAASSPPARPRPCCGSPSTCRPR